MNNHHQKERSGHATFAREVPMDSLLNKDEAGKFGSVFARRSSFLVSAQREVL